MRRMPLVVLGFLVGSLAGREALAACNLIPSASKIFRGAIGATYRPFAAPGDFVEVAVDRTRCDSESAGFAAEGADHVVTTRRTRSRRVVCPNAIRASRIASSMAR